MSVMMRPGMSAAVLSLRLRSGLSGESAADALWMFSGKTAPSRPLHVLAVCGEGLTAARLRGVLSELRSEPESDLLQRRRKKKLVCGWLTFPDVAARCRSFTHECKYSQFAPCLSLNKRNSPLQVLA